jgi:hypothetical protein
MILVLWVIAAILFLMLLQISPVVRAVVLAAVTTVAYWAGVMVRAIVRGVIICFGLVIAGAWIWGGVRTVLIYKDTLSVVICVAWIGLGWWLAFRLGVRQRQAVER